MGWEVERVLPGSNVIVPEDLECPVCKMVIKDALMCDDQHTGCSECIARCDFKCPTCRMEGERSFKVCRIVRKMVDKLQIRCRFAHSGCKHECTIEVIDPHESTCGYELLQCINGCEVKFLRKDADAHAVECLNQTVECDTCGIDLPRYELKEHDCLKAMLQTMRQLADRVKWLEFDRNKLLRKDPWYRRVKAHKGNTLCIISEGIEDIGGIALALTKNTSLEKLSLRNNSISDISDLGPVLRLNRTLEELDLTNNSIESLSGFCTGIQKSSLKILRLGYNQIATKSFSSLCSALKGNTNLEILSLRGIVILDIKPLINMLKTNPTLRVVRLSSELFTNRQRAQLLAAGIGRVAFV